MIYGGFADVSGSDVIQRLAGLGDATYAPAKPLRGVISDGEKIRTFLTTMIRWYWSSIPTAAR